jgi:hypothetical protein
MDDPNRDAKIEHISKWSASTSAANTKHVPFLATGRTMAPQSLLGELAEGGDGAHRLDLEEEPPRPAILPLVQEMRERESVFIFVAFGSRWSGASSRRRRRRSSILLSSHHGTVRTPPHCWCRSQHSSPPCSTSSLCSPHPRWAAFRGALRGV